MISLLIYSVDFSPTSHQVSQLTMSQPAIPSGHHSYDEAAISSVLAGVPTEVWASLQNYVGAMSTPPPGSSLQIPVAAASTAVVSVAPQKQKANSGSQVVVPAIVLVAPLLVLL